ncbi:Lipase 3 N-terminal region [Musa troglodytarum]|uniref:Lipase 3 N-terminal region n=1 Tax=Musa troglodytarum TaxID=320322 RepID=A0A9E7FTS8_9LILI|nr:Lipase 3 N-terminal region [Musa troglodytarum]
MAAAGLEWLLCLGCSRWAWKRLAYVGAYDSAAWPQATAEELEPASRVCRVVLAVYQDDLANPTYAPAGGYRMDSSGVVKRVPYDQIPDGRCPPYLIYVDREHKEVVLAVRGLNLVRDSDYKVLLDNRLGQQMFDGGFVHHGLLRAATWLLNREADTLLDLWLELGSEYKLVFAGHSLGSGIAALMTIIVVNHRDQFGGIPRSQIRCYAIAPARCMSLNLAVKYADVINSVILQASVTDLDSLPCFLCLVCMRDTFIPEKRKLKDPRRLYAPGRIYHIVERKFCRCVRYPPEVRTAIPVDGRFEHIVLSCSTTSDHAIVWIEREAQKALDLLKDTEPKTAPPEQKMSRKLSLEQEHKNALERAVTLYVPQAVVAATGDHSEVTGAAPSQGQEGATSSNGSKSSCRTNWDELVDKLFTRNESGNLDLKKDMNTVDG